MHPSRTARASRAPESQSRTLLTSNDRSRVPVLNDRREPCTRATIANAANLTRQEPCTRLERQQPCPHLERHEQAMYPSRTKERAVYPCRDGGNC